MFTMNAILSSAYLQMYGGPNTGAAYMTRRGWDGDPSANGSISFHGRSKRKTIVTVALFILAFLLTAAVVIIILLATGVIPTGPVNLDQSTASPLGPNTGIPPRPGTQPPSSSRSYQCSFRILRQANSAYNEKSSTTFQYAFSMIQSSLIDVITTSSLASYRPTVVMENLQNSGSDVQVDFRLTLSDSVDASVVGNVLRSQIIPLQARLGQNASIDPNSVRVVG